MDWLFPALLSAFALASADAITKRWLRDYRQMESLLARFGIGGVLLLPLLFLQPFPDLPPAFWGWIAVLAPLEIGTMWLYLRAIQLSPLSLTLPYLALSPVFVTVSGYLLLGEAVDGQGLLGVLLVVAGAYLLQLDQVLVRGWGAWAEPLLAIGREPGSWRMLAAAALYGVIAVMGKAALQYTEPAFFGPLYYVSLGVATVVLCLASPGPVRVLRRPGPALLVGVLMAVMIVSHFVAIERVQAAYMIAAKRTSLLFGILYGVWLFGERGWRHRLPAGALMVAGVALLVG